MLEVNSLHCSEPNNKKMEMNIYPNILTPPSSSEESPQSYTMPSPQYYYLTSPGESFATSHLLLTNQQQQLLSPGSPNIRQNSESYLKMIEQPVDKFRFRYKSEMAGTHGSLTGINSDKTRKQTYPTVKLCNFKGPAVIRCTLYQSGVSEEDRQPHAHRLIKKNGSEEVDDPHHLNVQEHDGYEACFHSMGIIHTAKKHLVEELKRKKTILKKEDIARAEGQERPLNKKEEIEITSMSEEESKSINLNIVCLRFDAFMKTPSGILQPICTPIYSHAINNLKSALTGELKIVRMDHSSSPSNGTREIFMLVEKVTKKNIRVRFFELDDDDNEIWSDFGKFSDLDVHHQYAIVFRTPAYKQVDIDRQKTVYIELLRPSDGSRSEAREFTYFPSKTYKPGSKRSRSSGYSTSGSWSNSFNSGELPVTVMNLPNMEFEASIPQVNSSDLEIALKNVDSEEFKKLFSELSPHMDITQYSGMEVIHQFESFTVDAPGAQLQASRGRNVIPYTDHTYTISDSDRQIMKRVYDELNALIKTRPTKRIVTEMLEHLFQKYLDDDFQNNALHLAVIAEDVKVMTFLLKTIHYLEKDHLINRVNINKETVMHLAVAQDNLEVALKILKHKPDLSIQDVNGDTVLHRAVRASCSSTLLATVLNCGTLLNLNVNAKNNDNYTALHMAVKSNNLSYVESLCKYDADVNDPDNKVGGSVLHIAITEQALNIVIFLLQHPTLDLTIKDFAGHTALQQAYLMKNEEIYKLIDEALRSRGLFGECVVKEEEESEEEMETDNIIECKSERLTPEELSKLYENVKTLTPECLDQVSELLDLSGSWECLADLLDLEHLVHTDWFAKAKSPSKALLNSAITFGDVLHIRNFLENLEELKAVEIIDRMVLSAKQ